MRSANRLSREEGGNVMVEFALIAPIFFLLVFGLVEFVLYQYKSYALSHIVQEATRNLQTGEVQAAANMRQKFDEMCVESAGPLMNCNDISWDVRSYDELSKIQYPPVQYDEQGLPKNFVFQPGGPSQFSVVRATIQHKFITPFMDKLFQMGPDRPAIANAFYVVRNEPWN